MKNQIELSVIIPAYNCEKTIENTINSIIEQHIDAIEILVIKCVPWSKILKLRK